MNEEIQASTDREVHRVLGSLVSEGRDTGGQVFSEVLDDLVHEYYEAEAAVVNNDGLERQLYVLLRAGYDPEDLTTILLEN